MARKTTRILECKSVPGVTIDGVLKPVTVTLFNTSMGRRMELQRLNIKAFDSDGDMPELALNPSVGALSKRSLIFAKSNEVLLRWAVKDITNYTIDDQPATLDSLIASGDEALVNEIVDDIGRDMGLTVTEGEPSPSPITSVAAADGEKNGMTAAFVNDDPST